MTCLSKLWLARRPEQCNFARDHNRFEEKNTVDLTSSGPLALNRRRIWSIWPLTNRLNTLLFHRTLLVAVPKIYEHSNHSAKKFKLRELKKSRTREKTNGQLTYFDDSNASGRAWKSGKTCCESKHFTPWSSTARIESGNSELVNSARFKSLLFDSA